jgi:hypothetical protein
MKTLIILAFAVTLIAADIASKLKLQKVDTTLDFATYKKAYNKNYGDKIDMKAEKTFKANIAKIDTHNRNKAVTYKMGVNHLTDKTSQEIDQMLGTRPENAPKQTFKSGLRMFKSNAPIIIPKNLSYIE